MGYGTGVVHDLFPLFLGHLGPCSLPRTLRRMERIPPRRPQRRYQQLLLMLSTQSQVAKSSHKTIPLCASIPVSLSSSFVSLSLCTLASSRVPFPLPHSPQSQLSTSLLTLVLSCYFCFIVILFCLSSLSLLSHRCSPTTHTKPTNPPLRLPISVDYLSTCFVSRLSSFPCSHLVVFSIAICRSCLSMFVQCVSCVLFPPF